MLWALLPAPAWAWGAAHSWIRQWAVEQQPRWVIEHFGDAATAALWQRYTSLQDSYAGSKDPALAPYCEVPGVRLSLHDCNPVPATLTGVRWYLDRITACLAAGDADEAMKFLGVLCHWNEDPGSLSAHASPVDEATLRELVPPRADQENRNYLYGAGWIGNERRIGLDGLRHAPRLLGCTPAEAAVQITHRQQALRRHAAGLIVPVLIGHIEGDEARIDAAIGAALVFNARFIADLIFTVGWLTADPTRRPALETASTQRLTEWLPPAAPGRVPQAYLWRPYLLDQALDSRRRLHPIAFIAADDTQRQAAFGIGMGTPATLTCTVANAGVYTRFTARAGVHPAAGPGGCVGFVVRVNGREVARVADRATGRPAEWIDVALPGDDVLEFALETVAGAGSEPAENLAVWVEPTLHRRPTRQPSTDTQGSGSPPGPSTSRLIGSDDP